MNPRMQNGKRYPRRGVPDNNSCCLLCRSAKCSKEHCRSLVHSSFWQLGLCYKHGNESVASSKRPASSSVPLAAVTDSNSSGNTFTARFKRSLQMPCSSRCFVRGCDAAARTFVSNNGSQLMACSLHRSWHLPRVEHSGRGYRHGYAAGRCKLDDYSDEAVLPCSLSPTGHFQHTCSFCSAFFFSAEGLRGKNTSNGPLFSRCCRLGRLCHLPLLPPAPASLAQLLTGCVAEDSALTWSPFTSAGILTGEFLKGPRKKASEDFRQNIRCYNTALGFASFTDSTSVPENPVDQKSDVVAQFSGSGPPVNWPVDGNAIGHLRLG